MSRAVPPLVHVHSPAGEAVPAIGRRESTLDLLVHTRRAALGALALGASTCGGTPTVYPAPAATLRVDSVEPALGLDARRSTRGAAGFVCR
jgi:hypothetical protein